MTPLERLLQQEGVQFEILHHESPLRTAQEGARYFGIDIGQTAPILILRTDEGYSALIVSGDRGKVDFEQVSQVLGCKTVKLASAGEVKKVTGYDVGSVSLVGHSLPCVLDKRLYRYASVYGGTGEPTSTLKIDPKALETLNQVVAVIE